MNGGAIGAVNAPQVSFVANLTEKLKGTSERAANLAQCVGATRVSLFGHWPESDRADSPGRPVGDSAEERLNALIDEITESLLKAQEHASYLVNRI